MPGDERLVAECLAAHAWQPTPGTGASRSCVPGSPRLAPERLVAECLAAHAWHRSVLAAEYLAAACLATPRSRRLAPERLAAACLVTPRSRRLAPERLAAECLATECLATPGSRRLAPEREADALRQRINASM